MQLLLKDVTKNILLHFFKIRILEWDSHEVWFDLITKHKW